ncbi:hypothetical protein [Escherichia phage SUSP2]|uniref:Uncharacterized protein n=2 Tax=Mooglevirus TaxID=1985303 RepID=A0A0N9RUW3_9CAUD|nr:hypothetical protein AVU07_agp138 [Escherichia phage phiSUSP1]YP_009211031.1 hypothetical protein AVU06_gp132 [Escherichia phage SUSP2]ALH47023.1 hypothetical protein [Escherichia phage phiSUSP1]ALH47156.1 hypothetical protein [Escherichia phage SUSP2]
MVSAGSTPAPASKFAEDRLQQSQKFLSEKMKRYGLAILNMVRKHIRHVRSAVNRMV